MKIIIIAGTPGTGKTTVAKSLSTIIEAKILSLNEIAISEEFSFDYDDQREAIIVDFKKFLPFVIKKIRKIEYENPKYLIIESHFSDIIPDKYIDFIFILRCDPDELVKRLKRRNYNKKKITENAQAEILGSSVNYFIQKKIKKLIFEIDTSKLGIQDVAKTILGIINNKINKENYLVGKINWLEKLYQEDRLKEFFE